MRITRAVLFVLFVLSIISTASYCSEQPVTVLEPRVTVTVQPDSLEVTLPLRSTAIGLDLRVQVELVDPADVVRATGESTVHTAAGSNSTSVRLHLPNTKENIKNRLEEDLLWSRIRYRVTSATEPEPLAEGTLALAAAAPDLFEIEVARGHRAIRGQEYRMRVHTGNPVTRHPVPDVAVFAKLRPPAPASPIVVSATTNANGDAVLLIPFPEALDEDSTEVEVEAKKNGAVRKESYDVYLDRNERVILSTDKSLYQPGQQLHVRMMAFSEDRKALAAKPVIFSLYDPDDSVLLRGKGETNRFGIASIDWQLPSNARLGDYHAAVRFGTALEDDTDEHKALVRVSRYELPTFSVSAKPDLNYYLPGQNAKLAVKAMYLFGKPVTHGTVRVVRETEHEWNSKTQKWETKEEESFNGDLDSSGAFTLNLDLAALHDDFEGEKENYVDHKYAVYVTDSTTGRIEQKRVTVRLSHDPIHIYVSDAGFINGRGSFYVSTFYPDGAPARAQVQISEVNKGENEYEDDPSELSHGPTLATVETNRYGIAKISDYPVGAEQAERRRIFVRAIDRKGASSLHVEPMWGYESKVTLNTDKTIYRPGEPIEISIVSKIKHGTLILELARERAVIRSQAVKLRHGRAFVVIPYLPQFEGVIGLIAYSAEQMRYVDYSYQPYAEGSIIYPRDQELNVKFRPERPTYRPGEEFAAALQVRSAEGAPVASAIGAVVIDKSVDERARTDQEFGRERAGFWNWGWWSDFRSYGGVSVAQLQKMDISQPVPQDLQLVAEMVMRNASSGYDIRFDGYDYESENGSRYEKTVRKLLEPVAATVRDKDTPGWAFPRGTQELRQQLKADGLDLDKIRDPWGEPFQFKFDFSGTDLTMEATSSGPDKKFSTPDDIGGVHFSWPVFTPIGKVILRVLAESSAKGSVLISDPGSLSRELLKRGFDLEAQRDPRGNPYRYQVTFVGPRLWVSAYRVERDPKRTTSSYPVWSNSIDYFEARRKLIDQALAKAANYPRTGKELDALLEPDGLALSKMRDPWGHPYYAHFSRESAYGDQVIVEISTGKQNQKIPVTRMIDRIYIRSAGPDGVPNTADDFYVADFERLVSVQGGADIKPQQTAGVPLIAGTGAIGGTVVDPSGAVIPNVKVVVASRDHKSYEEKTDSQGTYLIRDLEPGEYRLEASSAGFRSSLITEVEVFSGSKTVVSLKLVVGRATETVEVQANAVSVQTDSAMLAEVVDSAQVSSLPLNGKSLGKSGTPSPSAKFTPRVREYFPETLYWAPSLITDRSGNTRLKFKLADSITTWKFNLVASTTDGHIGYTESEITSFQPFFVDHAPPRILTVGDEIHLPVVVRNYLEKTQSVDVEMKPAGWMTLLNASKQSISVPAGDSNNAAFPFRAITQVTDGKQRVMAANQTLGDAIERPVTVHPDGEETSTPVTELFTGSGKVEFDVPAQVLGGSLHAEVKLYPNVLAQVADSIEGSLHRPYGCGEQTISSTYPSLLLLRYYREHNLVETPLSQRARKYLEEGYQRLTIYQAESGGFTYWGRGEGEVALTAYAIRFLEDASALIAVDSSIAKTAREWLLKQQKQDGSWAPHWGDAATVTAYVADVLAKSTDSDAARGLQHANDYLQHSAKAQLDPYIMAQSALAAINSKETRRADALVEQLRKMVHREGGVAYWALESNTAFYGWGRAGRVETTALVLQALASANQTAALHDPVINDGLKFLLKERDRYGVWYSGQATVNVLNALLLLLRESNAVAGGKATVLVNGTTAGTLDIPSSAELATPLTLELAKWVVPGANRVELKSDASKNTMTMSVTPTYYLPWSVPSSTREVSAPGESHGLRLAVRFDKTKIKAGDEVRCHVEAERFGHRGYGMMLAEIGLPPGAEVDRASLSKAMESWGVDQYDVLPDRIVLYLWPANGGTKVDFTFRPRYRMNAKTAPSILYDYYNPEAKVVLPPEAFLVQSKESN